MQKKSRSLNAESTASRCLVPIGGPSLAAHCRAIAIRSRCSGVHPPNWAVE